MDEQRRYFEVLGSANEPSSGYGEGGLVMCSTIVRVPVCEWLGLQSSGR